MSERIFDVEKPDPSTYRFQAVLSTGCADHAETGPRFMIYAVDREHAAASIRALTRPAVFAHLRRTAAGSCGIDPGRIGRDPLFTEMVDEVVLHEPYALTISPALGPDRTGRPVIILAEYAGRTIGDSLDDAEELFTDRAAHTIGSPR